VQALGVRALDLDGSRQDDNSRFFGVAVYMGHGF